MNKIILKDNTEFEICEGASLNNIKIITNTFEQIKSITDAFTKEDNLSNVQFMINDTIIGEYENLVYVSFSYIPSIEDFDNSSETESKVTSYIVTISLRESTEIELKIKKLETGHESNASAIEVILTDIIPSIDNENIIEE